MRFTLISLVATVSLLAACSSTPPMQAKATTTAPLAAQAPKDTAAARPAVQTQAIDPAQIEAQRLAAQRHQLADLNAQSVLFDFDDYTVKPDYTAMLQKQATFLSSAGAGHLTLQGNSDERGSTEYNLALGQKRADAVRKAMVLLGAPEGAIETISFGKEKPKADCHEESCWSQNRRVDFVQTLSR